MHPGYSNDVIGRAEAHLKGHVDYRFVKDTVRAETSPHLRQFQTDVKPFEATYAQNAHLQRGFNAQLVDAFIQYLLRVSPDARTRPISILDLCCGDGGITSALFDKLIGAGVQIGKIIGYDISGPQITLAKQYEREDGRLQFRVQDIKSMTDRAEYDFVISLFGLHWIEDIDAVAVKVSEALKPNGNLMYFVPLEKKELFSFRQRTMGLSNWQPHFTDYTLVPFHAEHLPYVNAFFPFFQSENKDEIVGMQLVEFSEERFKQFLASWMQEVRHLRPEDKEQYVAQLIQSLPADAECHDAVKVEIDGVPMVRFNERCYWFFGKKKSTENLEASSELVHAKMSGF